MIMKKIKLAYFGSPSFAADLLEKLIIDTTINQLIEVELVVTQEDRLVGRKQILTPTPVKKVAEKYNLKLLAPRSSKSKVGEISKCDIALVYAYGDLIPKEFLDLPKYGFWNIHPSLLPKYRGPGPITNPLINGDKITGVTIIKMDEEIDHGPIIVQESLMIGEDDKRPDLEKKLTDLGFEMIKKLLMQVEKKPVKPIEQNHNDATYTKKLSKQDGFIEFENLKMKIENSPKQLFDLFRGLYPWPGIWTTLPNGKRLKITNMYYNDEKLTIKKVQLESKNEVDFETFNKVYKIF